MKQLLKPYKIFIFALFAVTLATSFSLGHAAAAPAQPSSTCSKPSFFGLVPWYQYLKVKTNSTTGACEVKDFNILPNSNTGAKSDILLVLLAVVDDLLRLAGLIAVGFVVVGGIGYTTSQGNPEQTAKAQSTIINALIGLAIAIVAVGLVSFLGNQLGG